MNMSAARYYKQYSHNEISTSSQGKLILMMYDGAIKNVKLAMRCLEKKDIAGRGMHIRKSHDIINELSLALDPKKGADIAQKLERLYQFMLSQLILATIKAEAKPLESVLNVLYTLQEGWKQVVSSTHSDGTPKSDPSTNIIARG